MSKNLLDLDRVPTIEELREFFHENDFSTATYRDIDYDKMDADDIEALEYIKGLMGEKWDELSRGMGLKSDPVYYGKDNPLIAMRDSMETLASTGVMKLLEEMPERAEELLSDFTTPEDWESPEVLAVKADHMLSNAVSTLMQTMNYEEIAKVIAENPAYEDFAHGKPNNFRAKDFDRQWNHTRASVTLSSLEDMQISAYGEKVELNLPDASADVFEQVSSKLTEETFWSKLTEDDKIILLMRMDGKTQKEIAEHLGYKNHSAVTKRIKKLKDLFLECA
ncbi:MAG: hypothetical protein PHG19_07490 [Anaerotignum sp.]|nr:hypothetical protein [Anaerotignum sp.]